MKKNVSRTFKQKAEELNKTGQLDYKIRPNKPSEIRFYNLRKFFRKYANQMGFEHVNYLMNHKTEGSDANYAQKDPEFYRELYKTKAMPFLRLETPTPTETTEILQTLKEQHQKEIEAIKTQYEERLEKIENIIFPKVTVKEKGDWIAKANKIKDGWKNTPKKLKSN